ncbi:MAG: alpha/beta hydrolase [Cyanobacteria bacterium J069]
MLSALVVVGTGLPGWAAQQIYLRYGPLRLTVPIEAIANFAETGADSRLNTFIGRLNPSQRSQLQNALKANYDVDLMMVSQFSYTTSGERLLAEVGGLLRTASGQNGASSLRSAGILAAADPDGFSVLSFLRNLPVDMQIDVPQAIAFVQRLGGLQRQTAMVSDRVIQATQQVAAAESGVLQDLPPIDPRQTGSVPFRQQTLRLVDAKRVGASPAEQHRPLTVDLYLPQVDTPAPLIVVSNGLGARRDRFTRLASHLASHGFAVAIPDHPGSDRDRLQDFYNGRYRENFDPAEFTNRPLDISFLLDKLDELQQQGSLQGSFQGSDQGIDQVIDFERVGAFGYSFGGTTAFSLVGADVQLASLESACQSDSFILNISLLYQCQALAAPPPPLRDPRIKAVYAFLPFGKSLFGSNLDQIAVPVLWESSDEDLLTPLLEEQVPAFRQLTPSEPQSERYFILTQGLPHARISYEIAGRTAASDRLPWEALKAISERYHHALTLAFFQTHVAGNEDYRPFLTAAYAMQLAEPSFPIGFLHSLDAIADVPN